MAKRIAITTIGTLGDVQPFVALALTMRRRGFDVVLATSDDFKPFITSHGVEFASLGGDVQAFLRQSQFDSAMTKNVVLHAPGLLRDGQKIGVVSLVDHLPAQDLLHVTTDAGEVLVPFVKAIVPAVDIAAGTLTVTPPTGLFEELPDDPADEQGDESAHTQTHPG